MSRLNPWNLFFKSFCDHIEIVCIIITAISCIKMRKKNLNCFPMKYTWGVNKTVLTIKSFFSIFTVIYRYSYDPGWFGTWFRFCCHGQYSLFLNWATFPGKKESLREIKLIRDKKEDEQFLCISPGANNSMSCLSQQRLESKVKTFTHWFFWQTFKDAELMQAETPKVN